mmetsp:Transcript_5743/g.14692  ORF Transcript_5743/g.14692 Transcript_5743/m.14692 type:complete len:217 (+) Transcript_5743:42-692(+)
MAELTPYEAMIAANIRRNRAVLEALGLGRNDARRHEEVRSTAPKASGGSKGKPTATSTGEAQREAVRRSQRLAGVSAAADVGTGTTSRPGSANVPPSNANAPLDGTHERAKEDHARWAGLQKGVSPVGTASYEHTLHRVLTMSEAQLVRRMHAIERACGQHAVVKMKLFATVLALEGYAELAEDATDAYQRLVEKLGMPSTAHDTGDDEEAPRSGA